MILTRSNISGATTFWSLGDSDRAALNAGFAAAGLNIQVGERGECEALKRASKDYLGHKDSLVQARKSRKVYEGIRVRRDELGNDYTQQFAAGVVNGSVEVVDGYADTSELNRLYRVARSVLTPGAVGQVLVSQVQKLGGVSLVPRGGLYWLPEDSLNQWRLIGSIVEASALTKSYVHCIVTDRADEAAIRAVKLGLVSEITGELEYVLSRQRDEDLGQKALSHLVEYAGSLLAKAEKYEQLLGESLAEVKLATEKVQAEVAMAALASIG